jgi:hypothetical protein
VMFAIDGDLLTGGAESLASYAETLTRIAQRKIRSINAQSSSKAIDWCSTLNPIIWSL